MNKADSYTQDLIALMQSQHNASNELLESIANRLFWSSLVNGNDEITDKIIEDVRAHLKTVSSELDTFAKIKGIKLNKVDKG
jgi:hypothetical protein